MATTGTVRELLKIHPFELVEISALSYPKLEVCNSRDIAASNHNTCQLPVIHNIIAIFWKFIKKQGLERRFKVRIYYMHNVHVATLFSALAIQLNRAWHRIYVCLCFMCMIIATRFLYQVFPGTTSQCERLLMRASRVGEITTVEKLVWLHKYFERR